MMKILLLLLLFILATMAEASSGGRFFLEGDGVVQLKNLKSGRSESVRYRFADGTYNDAARKQVNALFGLKASDPVENISLRLIAILDLIQDQFGYGQKTVYLKSAYRSPQYNRSLRNQGKTVAKASTHMEGMAVDMEMAGVNGKLLWERLRETECCGVGWYGGASVHVDTGPPRFWTGATSKVGTDISEHNKKILLRTDRDIYRVGDAMELFIVRITEYPVGIKKTFQLVSVDEDGKEKRLKKIKPTFSNISSEQKEDCVMLLRPEEGRRIIWRLPNKVGALREAPLHVRVDFCNKPHEEMPNTSLSNRIEIHP